MRTIVHQWVKPDVSAMLPEGATVVITSQCGERKSLPVWALRQLPTTGLPCHDCHSSATEPDVA